MAFTACVYVAQYSTTITHNSAHAAVSPTMYTHVWGEWFVGVCCPVRLLSSAAVWAQQQVQPEPQHLGVGSRVLTWRTTQRQQQHCSSCTRWPTNQLRSCGSGCTSSSKRQWLRPSSQPFLVLPPTISNSASPCAASAAAATASPSLGGPYIGEGLITPPRP